MTTDQFWEMIEAAKGDPKQLEVALKELTAEEIDAWDEHYWRHHNALHRWDVWGAAYVINEGCGDDSFHYFKAFAIGKGKAFYEALNAAPDSIGDRITQQDLDNGCDNELLNYAAAKAYEAISGSELIYRSKEGSDPAGKEWDEDDLKKLFPRLWKRFA